MTLCDAFSLLSPYMRARMEVNAKPRHHPSSVTTRQVEALRTAHDFQTLKGGVASRKLRPADPAIGFSLSDAKKPWWGCARGVVVRRRAEAQFVLRLRIAGVAPEVLWRRARDCARLVREHELGGVQVEALELHTRGLSPEAVEELRAVGRATRGRDLEDLFARAAYRKHYRSAAVLTDRRDFLESRDPSPAAAKYEAAEIQALNVVLALLENALTAREAVLETFQPAAVRRAVAIRRAAPAQLSPGWVSSRDVEALFGQDALEWLEERWHLGLVVKSGGKSGRWRVTGADLAAMSRLSQLDQVGGEDE